MKQHLEEALDFIDDIPDDKLYGFPMTRKTVYTSNNLRLDMQCLTTHGDPSWNLQIQCNKHNRKKGNPKSSSNYAAEKAPRKNGSLAKILVPCDGSWSVSDVRSALVAAVTAYFT